MTKKIVNSEQRTKNRRGFTLVEIIVSVGLFALVMMIVAGSYLIMIGVNRQAQGIATGINNFAFTLESMTRHIRTGSNYSCGASLGLGDCVGGSSSFSFSNARGATVTYSMSGSSITKTANGITSVLTSPEITVTSLRFFVSGTRPLSAGDQNQPRVTMVVSGRITTGPGRVESFNIQTGATMRGTDL